MIEWRKHAAELLGAFILVFMGTTAVVAAGRASAPVLLVAAFAFGLALLAGLYAFGEISGGHFNPAVSLGMFLDRRLSSRDLAGYWISQFLGGILAALILLLATTKADVASTATKPSSNGTAFVIEVVLTAIFVLVILDRGLGLVHRAPARCGARLGDSRRGRAGQAQADWVTTPRRGSVPARTSRSRPLRCSPRHFRRPSTS
jgi:glycerol uptake facilitator-like aquaporin